MPAAEVLEGLLDRIEAHLAFHAPQVRRGELAHVLADGVGLEMHPVPRTRSPSVVCCKVNGMRETWITPGRGIAFTVRLTPSTAIEPSGTETSATAGGTATSISVASPERADRFHRADAVDVPLHQMTAQPIRRPERTLEIDAIGRPRTRRTRSGRATSRRRVR